MLCLASCLKMKSIQDSKKYRSEKVQLLWPTEVNPGNIITRKRLLLKTRDLMMKEWQLCSLAVHIIL